MDQMLAGAAERVDQRQRACYYSRPAGMILQSQAGECTGCLVQPAKPCRQVYCQKVQLAWMLMNDRRLAVAMPYHDKEAACACSLTQLEQAVHNSRWTRGHFLIVRHMRAEKADARTCGQRNAIHHLKLQAQVKQLESSMWQISQPTSCVLASAGHYVLASQQPSFGNLKPKLSSH